MLVWAILVMGCGVENHKYWVIIFARSKILEKHQKY